MLILSKSCDTQHLDPVKPLCSRVFPGSLPQKVLAAGPECGEPKCRRTKAHGNHLGRVRASSPGQDITFCDRYILSYGIKNCGTWLLTFQSQLCSCHMCLAMPQPMRQTQRVPRTCIQCARRKIKCSKKIPCEECIRRGDTVACKREIVRVHGKVTV